MNEEITRSALSIIGKEYPSGRGCLSTNSMNVYALAADPDLENAYLNQHQALPGLMNILQGSLASPYIENGSGYVQTNGQTVPVGGHRSPGIHQQPISPLIHHHSTTAYQQSGHRSIQELPSMNVIQNSEENEKHSAGLEYINYNSLPMETNRILGSPLQSIPGGLVEFPEVLTSMPVKSAPCMQMEETSYSTMPQHVNAYKGMTIQELDGNGEKSTIGSIPERVEIPVLPRSALVKGSTYANKDEAQLDQEAEVLWVNLRRCPQYIRYRARQPKNSDNSEDQKWPDVMEFAFCKALVAWPPMGRKKTTTSTDSKHRGRNELIADAIHRWTGKKRTRKQISSHIQVLKPMIEDDPEIAQHFFSDHPSSLKARLNSVINSVRSSKHAQLLRRRDVKKRTRSESLNLVSRQLTYPSESVAVPGYTGSLEHGIGNMTNNPVSNSIEANTLSNSILNGLSIPGRTDGNAGITLQSQDITGQDDDKFTAGFNFTMNQSPDMSEFLGTSHLSHRSINMSSLVNPSATTLTTSSHGSTISTSAINNSTVTTTATVTTPTPATLMPVNLQPVRAMYMFIPVMFGMFVREPFKDQTSYLHNFTNFIAYSQLPQIRLGEITSLKCRFPGILNELISGRLTCQTIFFTAKLRITPDCVPRNQETELGIQFEFLSSPMLTSPSKQSIVSTPAIPATCTNSNGFTANGVCVDYPAGNVKSQHVAYYHENSTPISLSQVAPSVVNNQLNLNYVEVDLTSYTTFEQVTSFFDDGHLVSRSHSPVDYDATFGRLGNVPFGSEYWARRLPEWIAMLRSVEATSGQACEDLVRKSILRLTAVQEIWSVARAPTVSTYVNRTPINGNNSCKNGDVPLEKFGESDPGCDQHTLKRKCILALLWTFDLAAPTEAGFTTWRFVVGDIPQNALGPPPPQQIPGNIICQTG